MATFQTYNGNGSTTAFTFTFPYINTDDIKASISDVATTAFSVSGSTLTFTSAPASGNNNVKIFRETNNTTIQADFQSGSALRAVDLNDNFTQVLYVTQEATDGSTTAVSDSAAAVTTANTASTNATNAVNTANTASTNATTALNTANSATTAANAATSASNTATSTANTAATNASAAVVTANAASATATTAATNASNAVTTANSASSTANTAATNASNAVTTANTASTNASNAVTTANAASTTANTALTNSRESDGSGGFNTAISIANTASTTATTASTNASSAVTTANTASTNASTAVTTANSATATANAAASTVASAVFYTPVANFASFPGSPSNQDRIEVTNSTGLESQSSVSGIPSGFTGSSDLTMRLQYNSSTSKWEFQQYFAEDPEARYMPKQGGTMTGLLTLSGAPTANLHAASKAYVDAANTTQDTTVATNATNIAANVTAIATKMATAGGTFTGDVSFDDNVIVKGDGTNGSGELTLNCENNSHGIKIKGPPHSAGANYTLTLPNDTGTNGQALITNGSGVSSWSTTVAGRNLSADGTKLDGIETAATADQTAAEILTAIKTVDGGSSGLDADLLDGQHGSYYTGYTDTAVSNLVDSSPATLNTLNELAAALGDDPNFATTTANSIGTKLPLAGGTLTGGLTGTTAAFSGSVQCVNEVRMIRGSNRVNLGGSDVNAVFAQSGNFNIKWDGSAIFADTLKVEGSNTPAGRYSAISKYGSILIGTTSDNVSDARAYIDAGNGSASFSGGLATIDQWGQLNVNTPSSTGYAFQSRILNGSATCIIEGDGSATFAGSMAVSGTGQYTGGQRGAVYNLGNNSGSVVTNMNIANNFILTLIGGTTLANPSNQNAGQHGVFRINQDGTGGRTLAFGSHWKFPGGTAPTLSTAANAQDLLAYYVAANGTIMAQLIVDLK